MRIRYISRSNLRRPLTHFYIQSLKCNATAKIHVHNIDGNRTFFNKNNKDVVFRIHLSYLIVLINSTGRLSRGYLYNCFRLLAVMFPCLLSSHSWRKISCGNLRSISFIHGNSVEPGT